MVDLEYLNKLLILLNTNNVQSFKMNGLELYFGGLAGLGSSPKIDTKDHTIEVPIDESTLPPDLRTDAINNYDAIMNWSGSQTDGEVVGTGDEPLSSIDPAAGCSNWGIE